MLQSLVRWKFVDRTWAPDDLDDIADWWLLLYERADHPEKPCESDQILEIRLTGFPRSAAEATADELVRRLTEAGIKLRDPATRPVLRPSDPDTLFARTKRRDGNRRPLPGLGVHTLTGPPFDGMVIELRFTVVDAGATKLAPEVVGATLVIVGELRNGKIAVKAVWVVPPFVEAGGHWATSSVWEDEILAHFDNYRSYRKRNREFACHLFNHLALIVSPSAEPASRTIGWLTNVPFGRPRADALYWRFGICVAGALFFPLVFLLAITLLSEPGSLIYPICILGLPWLLFVIGFIGHEYQRYFSFYTQWRDYYDQYYHKPVRYSAIPPSAPQPWSNDPIVCKLTAEVLEAGFVHAGDAAAVPCESAGQVHRIFLAPDGVTYLVLAFEHTGGSGAARSCIWPAGLSSVLCQTFNFHNCRFETTTFEPPFWVLKREVPTARWLVHPPATYFLDLYCAHVKAVGEWAKESGAPLLSHEQFDRYVARQDDISRQECAIYRDSPYTRADHWRWYLQRDAKPPENSK